MIQKFKIHLINAAIIFVVWLATYTLCQILVEQRLGWDEIAYLSVAKGIIEDFDFSARSYTIMGILKQGYPSHLINFPLFPLYLAIFFKLFGSSLHIAYFCNWFTGLLVCFLIYFIFLTLYEKSYKLALLVSIFYLFLPGIIKNCDSGMMEQTGCFLISLFVLWILRDLAKGKLTYYTTVKFAISFTVLYMYKNLYVGYMLGAFVLMCLLYNKKTTNEKVTSKVPLPVFLFISYGLFVLFYYIFTKFVFYSLSPMMTFSPLQEVTQVYADFMGGFLNDPIGNLIRNFTYFLTVIIAAYFVYPSGFFQYTSEVLNTTGYVVALGVYYFFFLIIIILFFSYFKRLSPLVRLFILFSILSILFFNLAFNLLLTSYHGNVWRYNVYYYPLYLISLGILLTESVVYIKPFASTHPVGSKALVAIIFIFCYFPLFLSMLVHYVAIEEPYHNTAKSHADIIRSFLRGAKPMFVYFTHGTHTTYTDYPIRQIFRDATNEQLLKVNEILPEPIEFLFLRPTDWLFKNNQDLILKGEPILNNSYVLYGYNQEAGLVVYKYK